MLGGDALTQRVGLALGLGDGLLRAGDGAVLVGAKLGDPPLGRLDVRWQALDDERIDGLGVVGRGVA
jgi:hypothetical protein